jgi:hypothetical protein
MVSRCETARRTPCLSRYRTLNTLTQHARTHRPWSDFGGSSMTALSSRPVSIAASMATQTRSATAGAWQRPGRRRPRPGHHRHPARPPDQHPRPAGPLRPPTDRPPPRTLALADRRHQPPHRRRRDRPATHPHRLTPSATPGPTGDPVEEPDRPAGIPRPSHETQPAKIKSLARNDQQSPIGGSGLRFARPGFGVWITARPPASGSWLLHSSPGAADETVDCDAVVLIRPGRGHLRHSQRGRPRRRSRCATAAIGHWEPFSRVSGWVRGRGGCRGPTAGARRGRFGEGR